MFIVIDTQKQGKVKEYFCSTSQRKPQSEEKEESVPNNGAFLPFFLSNGNCS